MVLHTGGARGADYYFAKLAENAGWEVILHSFEGHKPILKDLQNYKLCIHIKEELQKVAFPKYHQANLVLNRQIPYKEYSRNLILRDYFQIENSDLVVAVAPLLNEKIVRGGTGYAIQMAIEKQIPIILFDDGGSNKWHYYSYKKQEFVEIDHNPPKGYLLALKKYQIVTGIGTRNITGLGIEMVKLLF